MDIQSVYSYYSTALGLVTNAPIVMAVIAAVLVVAWVRTTQSSPERKKAHSGGPDFFIPELGAARSEDAPNVVSPVTATVSMPDGEDILSDMYAEKAAVISMLDVLREELIASESQGAIRAIDVLIADFKRRDVNSVWQLGASRIADGTR